MVSRRSHGRLAFQAGVFRLKYTCEKKAIKNDLPSIKWDLSYIYLHTGGVHE